jgi:co-chaperonin GroES (HSP10)
MRIVPLNDNVLIKPLKEPEKRESGLVVPESDKGEVLTGEVIAVGKNADEILQEGKQVAYAKYSGHEIGEYLLISEKDILGIIENG